MTVLMPVLAVVATLTSFAIVVFFAPLKHDFPIEVAMDDIARTIYSLDMLVTLMLKNAVIGFFVGVVCCYKGLTCRLGSEGVGRAVNQAVVITFFGVWLWNSAFNLAYLSLFPDASVFRG
jgi:phospholipid/cholesterol/gamma-HCH transport system permease protein